MTTRQRHPRSPVGAVCSVALAAGLALALGCSDGSLDTEARIDALFAEVPYGTLNREQARRVLETALGTGSNADRAFELVELVRFRERASYRDGRPTDASGEQAAALYAAELEPILESAAAELLYVAQVERNLIDPDSGAWDLIRVVRFPSRASFVEMLERRDFRSAAEHQVAAVERAIVVVAEALPSRVPEELRHVDLAAVPFPPTASDPPVTIVHLLDFNEAAQYADGRSTTLTGREAFALYEQGRAPEAVPLGVRPAVYFAVEGELVGDGRPWEEVRVNNFPSRATFAQLASAESLDRAGYEHRVAGLARTYAMMAAPVTTQIGYPD